MSDRKYIKSYRTILQLANYDLQKKKEKKKTL